MEIYLHGNRSALRLARTCELRERERRDAEETSAVAGGVMGVTHRTTASRDQYDGRVL
jgi:hypothetical protein